MTTVIDAREISKTFQDGEHSRRTLETITLKVESGQLVTVAGRSGSGKSTLLAILGGLDRDFEGSLLLFGRAVQQLEETEIARLRGERIGFVFQNYQLLMHRTVIDNVLMPTLFSERPDAAREHERGKALLGKLGLGDRLAEMPAALSGGQRQRVALARALIREPELLLCDEPTGNLDDETSDLIIRMLAGWVAESEGRAVVAVTHAKALMDAATHHYALESGELFSRQRPGQRVEASS